MSWKSSVFWATIEANMADGNMPDVFINPAGKVCLHNGWNGAEFPARLLHLLPPAIIEAANVKAAERAAADKARLETWRAEVDATSAALNARLDEPGFVLLAGEDTAIVASGTLRECRDAMYKVPRCRRDSYSGRGCWVIVDSKHVEVEAGQFTKDGLF